MIQNNLYYGEIGVDVTLFDVIKQAKQSSAAELILVKK
jgi:hypothetical protein